MASFEQYRAAYADNWAALRIRPERAQAADRAAKTLLAGRARYQIVQARTGVQWWFAGLCHYRESDFNFGTYLGNGQSLGRRTSIVPIGRGPFFGNSAFEDGAVDALTLQGFAGASDWSIERAAYRLEGFNGYGYHDPFVRGTNVKLGHPVPSPYIYGGSTIYVSGKYTRDHYFDPDFVDSQLGTLVVLKALCALDSSIGFAAPAAAEPHEEALAHGVAWAQDALNRLGADPQLTVDGKAGNKTMAMLAQFQAENALPETGLLDRATLDEIDKHLHAPVAAPASAPHSLADDILAALHKVFG